MQDITKTYKMGEVEIHAVDHISFSIEQGELVVIVGPSGAGKTTVLNILGGMDTATSGKLYVDGKDITAYNSKQLTGYRRDDIGFVFQSVALLPTMNAVENVAFALRLAGIRQGREERAQECLRMVGLGNRMEHMPQELSGGEQQRVAIARAIAHRPQVIFADEPTAALDTTTKLQVVKIFQELAEKEGLTFVMTTHDIGIMDLGDRVYELQDGEVVQ